MKELSPETEERIFRRALETRCTEEALLGLFSEGKLSGTLHTCIGQELTGAVLAELLRAGDTVFSNHRGHGHFISFTGAISGLIAEVMGRTDGVCGGYGGSQHLCHGGFFSNGIQGGIVPVAAGLAYAARLRGGGDVCVVFIGDGTLGEGVVYEAFNLAARWSLPLLVVLEDNGIAQSTPQSEVLAGSIEARAAGFGLAYAKADTWDWRTLYASAAGLMETVRAGGGPALLHVRTFRLKAHSKGDDTRARSEIEPYERRDPVSLFAGAPSGSVLAEEARKLVASAVAAAGAAEHAVYRPPAPAASKPPGWSPVDGGGEKLVKVLNRCLERAMRADGKIIMIGEDIESPYGGAFKVTQGLSAAFPGRVRNTPISEGGG
jgi:2-oxoisovalerate dehydrogenase E1 component